MFYSSVEHVRRRVVFEVVIIAFNYLANQVGLLESSRSFVDVIYFINRDLLFVLLAGPVRNCVGVFAQSRFRGRRNSDVHQASSQT